MHLVERQQQKVGQHQFRNIQYFQRRNEERHRRGAQERLTRHIHEPQQHQQPHPLTKKEAGILAQQ